VSLGAGGWLARFRALVGAVERPPSLLVVVAHPDDESIGAGALMAALPEVSVLFTTDGAPRDLRDALAAGHASAEEYAAARRREALAALAVAGVPPERIRCLGFADQALSLSLAQAVAGIGRQVLERRPDVVLTHAYEGGHPDHDATAFAVHAALASLRASGARTPALVEMGLYHQQAGTLRRLELPPGGRGPAVTCALDRHQRARKRLMAERYASQRQVIEGFPLDVERFRLADPIDFSGPPHAGLLHYERQEWGMTGERWRRLAGEAAAALGLEAPF
jgi:LmbE family N-acetylglucosaminyl deacetylase